MNSIISYKNKLHVYDSSLKKVNYRKYEVLILFLSHIYCLFSIDSRWSCPETELWGAAQLPVSSAMPPDLCLAMHTSNS